MSNVVRDVRSISIDEMELYVATESKSYLNITSPSYEGDGAPFVSHFVITSGYVMLTSGLLHI